MHAPLTGHEVAAHLAAFIAATKGPRESRIHINIGSYRLILGMQSEVKVGFRLRAWSLLGEGSSPHGDAGRIVGGFCGGRVVECVRASTMYAMISNATLL
jgi:hypothetical protein